MIELDLLPACESAPPFIHCDIVPTRFDEFRDVKNRNASRFSFFVFFFLYLLFLLFFAPLSFLFSSFFFSFQPLSNSRRLWFKRVQRDESERLPVLSLFFQTILGTKCQEKMNELTNVISFLPELVYIPIKYLRPRAI